MTFLTINNLKAALCSGIFLSPQAGGGAGLLEKAVLILLTPTLCHGHTIPGCPSHIGDEDCYIHAITLLLLYHPC